MTFHENRLPADNSCEYHALFVIFEKATNLKLSSSANYTKLIQASLCKIQSCVKFKDFSRTFLLFSRTVNL